MGIDLGYHNPGAFGGGGGQVGRHPIADISLLVRAGAVEQHYIHRPCPVAEQSRHLPEEAGSGGSIPLVYPFPDIVGDETGVDKEGILVLRFAIGGFALGDGKSGIEDDTPQLVATACHRCHQSLRDGGGALYVDMVAALYQLYSLVGRPPFQFIVHRSQFVIGCGQKSLLAGMVVVEKRQTFAKAFQYLGGVEQGDADAHTLLAASGRGE